MRLDVALILRYPELSRRRAREAIEKGQVSLAGQIVRAAGHRVEESAAIHWDPNRRALPLGLDLVAGPRAGSIWQRVDRRHVRCPLRRSMVAASAGDE